MAKKKTKTKVKNRKLNIRQFLNKPGNGGVAAIRISCGTIKPKKENKDQYLDIYPNFTLSDCSRSVSFEVDVHSKKEYANSLDKLKKIRDSVEKLINHLESHHSAIKTYW